MNPDEFEQYLGLGGPANYTNPYASESSQRASSAFDKVLAGEFQGDIEDSYSQ